MTIHSSIFSTFTCSPVLVNFVGFLQKLASNFVSLSFINTLLDGVTTPSSSRFTETGTVHRHSTVQLPLPSVPSVINTSFPSDFVFEDTLIHGIASPITVRHASITLTRHLEPVVVRPRPPLASVETTFLYDAIFITFSPFTIFIKTISRATPSSLSVTWFPPSFPSRRTSCADASVHKFSIVQPFCFANGSIRVTVHRSDNVVNLFILCGCCGTLSNAFVNFRVRDIAG